MNESLKLIEGSAPYQFLESNFEFYQLFMAKKNGDPKDDYPG